MIQTPSCVEAEVDRALCRSMLYDILGQCLLPPSNKMLRQLSAPSTRETVHEAALDLSPHNGEAIEDLLREASRARVDELSKEFALLFGEDARGARVPPLEATYESEEEAGGGPPLATIHDFSKEVDAAITPEMGEPAIRPPIGSW